MALTSNSQSCKCEEHNSGVHLCCGQRRILLLTFCRFLVNLAVQCSYVRAEKGITELLPGRMSWEKAR